MFQITFLVLLCRPMNKFLRHHFNRLFLLSLKKLVLLLLLLLLKNLLLMSPIRCILLPCPRYSRFVNSSSVIYSLIWFRPTPSPSRPRHCCPSWRGGSWWSSIPARTQSTACLVPLPEY